MNERVKLDITTIPDDLYDLVLAEFRRVYGEQFSFDEWEISAVAVQPAQEEL